MRELIGLIIFVLTSTISAFGQTQNNENDVKYVIFTSNKDAEVTKEGIFKSSISIILSTVLLSV